MIQLTLPLPADYDRRPEHERRVFSWLQRWSHALTLEDVARLLAATRGELEADAGVVMDDARALAWARGVVLGSTVEELALTVGDRWTWLVEHCPMEPAWCEELTRGHHPG